MSVQDGRDKGVTGGGAKPPGDAPVETAQTLAPETIQVQQERARSNERTLAPFKPQKGAPLPPTAVISPKPVVVADPPDQAAIDEFFGSEAVHDRPGFVVAGQGESIPPIDPQQGEVDQVFDIPPLTDEDRLRMPAASDTDTPSRGLLPNLTPPKGDKFEGISRGGFGNLDDAQYEPLNGSEVLELALELADELVGRIKNDLRFSMALVYPRIAIRLRLEVEGHADDDNAGFTIEHVRIPKEGTPGGTPMDIARLKANQVCFVVEAARREMTPEGESENPPDKIRDDLGLSKPRKQQIESNGMSSFVDIGSPGGDVRALTR